MSSPRKNNLQESKHGLALICLTAVMVAAFGYYLMSAAIRPVAADKAGLVKLAAKPDAENTRSPSRLSAPDEATRTRLSESYGKLPLQFEANEGQTDPRVKFTSRGNGYNLFLTSDEAVIQLRNADYEMRKEDSAARIANHKNQKSKIKNQLCG